MSKLDKILLSRALLTKAAAGVAAAAALTTGTVLGVSAYRSGNDFHPSGTERDFNANQVHFDDNDDVKGSDSTAEQDDSEMIEKDDTADDTDDPNSGDNADFMFQRERMQENFADPVSLVSNASGANVMNGGVTASGSGDSVYNVTNDRNNADVIIGGRPGGTTVAVPADGGNGTGTGTGSGETPGGNGGTTTPTNPVTPSNPSEPSTPSTPSTPSNNKPSKPSGGDNGGGTVTPTPGQDTNYQPSQGSGLTNDPTQGTGETSTDPDGIKSEPGGWSWGDDRAYIDGEISESDNADVVIEKPDGAYTVLYQGQKNVTKLMIFNSLATYVQKDAWSERLLWNSAEDHFNKYIRIDSVYAEIDGNLTELKFTEKDGELTIDIPENAESLKINVSYRFSQNSDNWQYKQADYALEQSRLIILNTILEKNNQKIEDSMVLNPFSDQTPDSDTPVNLYQYIEQLMKANGLLDESSKQIFALFPGWKENDEFVPWNYEVTTGRHVLEPAARVLLDKRYTVKMKYGDVYDGPSFVSLQTLTGYNSEAVDTLEVPMYVQAVKMDEDNTLSSVKYLKLPSTVRSVDTEGEYMKVMDGYIVDDDNPAFSTVNGILTNKDETQFLGIPYDRTELTIPEGVRRVTLPSDTKVTKIKIETTDPEQLPYINFGGMTSGVIEVDDSVLGDFANNNRFVLSGKNIDVISSSQIVKNDAVLSDKEKTLEQVLSTDSIYNVPNTVTTIGENAFTYNNYINTVILPNCDNLVLKPGCFADSTVSKLMVYSETQKKNVEKQLQAMGLSEDDISVLVLSKTQEGSTYYVDDDDTDENNSETVLLLPAANVTSFTGVETAQDGSTVKFTTIADGAFRNSKTLQWAIMDKCVKNIGANAFEGCSALEGILIDSRDTVSIGSGAFDSCPSLYFIASNAKTAELADWFYINKVNNSSNNNMSMTQVYCPTDNEGYDYNWSCFRESDDVACYGVIDLANGGKMLYGYGADGNPQMALRAGKTLKGKIELPSTTRELFERSMQDIPDEFTLNWDGMPNLIAVDEWALAYSGLQGSIETSASRISSAAFFQTGITDVTFTGPVQYINERAFGWCRALTNVDISEGFDPYNSSLGSNAFGGCSSLEQIKFGGMNVPDLTLSGADSRFVFNEDWDDKEEASKITLAENLSSSEYMITQLVKTWRYAMIGCSATQDELAYQRLWNRYYYSLDVSLQGDERMRAADAAVKQDVLDGENRIRRLLGVAEVDDPTAFYPYHISDDGMLTLVGAPANTEGVTLNCPTLEIPDEWCLDYVGTGAFSNSKNLQSVNFDYGLAGIEYDAFKGVGSDSLTLQFHDSYTIPELILEEEGKPFSFGVDESNIHITLDSYIFEPNYEGYIKKWAYPLAGYSDYQSMYDAVAEKLGDDADEKQIHAEMTELLLDAENRLRNMMGLETVEKLSFELAPEEDTDTDESDDIDWPDDIEWPDNSELPDWPDEDQNSNTDSGSSDSNGTDTPTIDDDTANEPTDDNNSSDNSDNNDTSNDTDNTVIDKPIVLPMENGKYEIVIPSISSDSASTEDKGETE